jgi:hypothetical protein
MWSDNEHSAVARRRNAVIDALDIRFSHSHGQINDDVRVRHESSHYLGTAVQTFRFREANEFRPWMMDRFIGDDGDSDGVYSPSWYARLAIYWNQPARSAAGYLELHRESLRRRKELFGPQAAQRDFEVLIPTVQQRREMLDVLVDELTRQGVPFLIDDRTGVPVGDKRNQLIERATAPYVTFVDDDDWISHHYGEVIGDALAANRHGIDVLLYDVLTSFDAAPPRPSMLTFDLGYANLPDCYLRLPNHLMVWKREVAGRERFPSKNTGEDAEWAARMGAHVSSWARVRGFLYFYEFLWASTTTQR